MRETQKTPNIWWGLSSHVTFRLHWLYTEDILVIGYIESCWYRASMLTCGCVCTSLKWFIGNIKTVGETILEPYLHWSIECILYNIVFVYTSSPFVAWNVSIQVNHMYLATDPMHVYWDITYTMWSITCKKPYMSYPRFHPPPHTHIQSFVTCKHKMMEYTQLWWYAITAMCIGNSST